MFRGMTWRDWAGAAVGALLCYIVVGVLAAAFGP